MMEYTVHVSSIIIRIMRPGTANAIAHSLKFKNALEMKNFIDKNFIKEGELK